MDTSDEGASSHRSHSESDDDDEAASAAFIALMADTTVAAESDLVAIDVADEHAADASTTTTGPREAVGRIVGELESIDDTKALLASLQAEWSITDEQVHAQRGAVHCSDEAIGIEPEFDDESVQQRIEQDPLYVATVQRRRAILRALADEAESRLFTWSRFDVELPPTSFTERFEYPQRPHENVQDLAIGEDGSLRPLSLEQRNQIRRTGTFEVPSSAFPGKTHRWKLTNWLQRGSDNAWADLKLRMSWVLFLIVIWFPRMFRIMGKALYSIGGLVRDTVGRLVGVPAPRAQFNNEQQRQDELVRRRRDWVISGFRPTYVALLAGADDDTIQRRYRRQFVTSGDEVIVDVRLWSREFVDKSKTDCTAELSRIQAEHDQIWALRKNQLLDRLFESEHELGDTEDKRDREIARVLREQERELLFELIRSSTELKKRLPGGIPTLIDTIKANFLVSNVVQEHSKSLSREIKAERARLQREYPVRSLVHTWMKRRLRALFERRVNESREPLFAEILAALEAMPREPPTADQPLAEISASTEGHELTQINYKTEPVAIGRRLATLPSQVVHLAQRDIEYRRTLEEQERRAIADAKVYSVLYLSRTIWNPHNWEIRRWDNEQNHRHGYTVTTKVVYELSKSLWFWRLRWFALLLFVGSSEFLRALLLGGVWASRFGIRGLFFVRRFRTEYIVNQDTGAVELSDRLTGTYCSALRNIRSLIRNSRRNFEERPDRSFFGKKVSRIFNIVFNYLIRLPTLLIFVGIGYPVISIVTIIGSLLLAATFWIWVPLAAIIVYLVHLVFYDLLDSRGKPSSWPIVRLVCRLLFRVIGRFVVALVCAVLLVPLGVVFGTLYAVVRYVFRVVLDWVLFWFCIRWFGRVSAQDDHIARRIAGPGLAYAYFNTVDVQLATVAVLAYIENWELDTWQRKMQAKARAPLAPMSELSHAFSSDAVSISLSKGRAPLGPICDRVRQLESRIQELQSGRKQILPPYFPDGASVRLSREALAQTISVCHLLVLLATTLTTILTTIFGVIIIIVVVIVIYCSFTTTRRVWRYSSTL